MNENNVVFSRTSTPGEIHSDLQRVDAHVIQPEEYEEIPEITEEDFAEAVIKLPGQPDQPFLINPPKAP
ncbi:MULTISPECIES: hypothetical protein [unclassified Synechococcus]|uniref:hypothetical protein n=1 Tax=unclassified Synechococcus TaxID=2626047 RepID=UPI0021A4D1C8|nr:MULTISPECIES: hypothetical protein [unclassified Synechococcus]MCT0213301.1 hypothetical protein [Synechococcus sp. CS-1326]MCT0232845.1 hypothetical protein [Synechococcus sp. CS-1327]